MQKNSHDLCVKQANGNDKPMLWALLQAHLHEFPKHSPNDIPDANGVYPYKYFDLYWSDPKREALVFWQGNEVIGFALINDWSASGLPTDRSMAEFYIGPEFRRSGYGRYLAQGIIDGRKGQWEIPVAQTHPDAQSFWRKVLGPPIQEITGDGARWAGPIFRFTSR